MEQQMFNGVQRLQAKAESLPVLPVKDHEKYGALSILGQVPRVSLQALRNDGCRSPPVLLLLLREALHEIDAYFPFLIQCPAGHYLPITKSVSELLKSTPGRKLKIVSCTKSLTKSLNIPLTHS